MSGRGDALQKRATVDGDETLPATSVLGVPPCTTGHTWQLGGTWLPESSRQGFPAGGG